jgi:hypothetical protein
MRETDVESHPFRKVREKDGATPASHVWRTARDTRHSPKQILLWIAHRYPKERPASFPLANLGNYELIGEPRV